MSRVAVVMTALVGVLHLLFMVAETVGWSQMGRGMGMSREEVESARVLAANQGVYNGVLGASLLWSSWRGEHTTTVVLLLFVILVGLYGGATAKWTIWLVQPLPAAIALFLVLRG